MDLNPAFVDAVYTGEHPAALLLFCCGINAWCGLVDSSEPSRLGLFDIAR